MRGTSEGPKGDKVNREVNQGGEWNRRGGQVTASGQITQGAAGNHRDAEQRRDKTRQVRRSPWPLSTERKLGGGRRL